MLSVPMTFLAASGWIFFLSYRASLSWAPITFVSFESFQGQFVQELKHYVSASRAVLAIAAGTIAFVLSRSALLVPQHHKIRLWAPECILLGLTICLCIAFEISTTAAYWNYRREYRFTHDDERFRRWYALNQSIAVTAICSLCLAYLGLVVTIFG